MPKLKYNHLLPSMTQLYQSGQNCNQIGKLVGVDGDTVKRYLVTSGVVKIATKLSRTDNRKMATAIKPEDIEQLKTALQPGDTIKYRAIAFDDKLNRVEVIRSATVINKYNHLVLAMSEDGKAVYPSYVDILQGRKACHGK